jgi:hypothetical protein
MDMSDVLNEIEYGGDDSDRERDLADARKLIAALAQNDPDFVAKKVGLILRTHGLSYDALDPDGETSIVTARQLFEKAIQDRHADIACNLVTALRTLDKPMNVTEVLRSIESHRKAGKRTYEEVRLSGRAELIELGKTAKNLFLSAQSGTSVGQILHKTNPSEASTLQELITGRKTNSQATLAGTPICRLQ